MAEVVIGIGPAVYRHLYRLVERLRTLVDLKSSARN